MPIADPRPRATSRILLSGDVPSPIDPPAGCRFHPRCRVRPGGLLQIEPPLEPKGVGAPRRLPLPAWARARPTGAAGSNGSLVRSSRRGA